MKPRTLPGPTMLDRFGMAWQALTGSARRRSLYDGAETNRLLMDWIASRLSPGDETRSALPILRDRSRDLQRNNPYARHFLRMLKTNVIGAHGIRLQAQVMNNDGKLAKPINDRIEAAWAEWCRPKNCSRNGRLSFTALSHLTLSTVARDGEAFVRMHTGFKRNRFGFALEPIPSDLIDEQLNEKRGSVRGRGEITNGVETDEDGRPVAYHGWNALPRQTAPTDRARVVYPADQIIHLYDPDSVGQIRGVPWMCSVMVPMHNLKEYAHTEAVAARVSAAKMGVLQRKDDSSATTISGDGTFEFDANPGGFLVAPSGWEMTMFSPEHPATAFSAFMKSQLRDVATGVGVTYNALANDLEGVNYSSMRSGLLIERDLWRLLQQWWIDSFVWPVYEGFMNASFLSGALLFDQRDFDRFLSARWAPRGWPWVDPLKDMQSAVLGIQNGLASRTALLSEQGLDIEQVIDDLKEEADLADVAGVKIDGPEMAADSTADTGDDAGADTGTNTAAA